MDEQERHADLIEVWRVRLPTLDEEGAHRTRARIAERYLSALKDAASALAAVRELLESGGSIQPAVELLEAISVDAAASDETRRAALALLDELYTRIDDAPALVRVLERGLGLARDLPERVTLHRRSSELLAGLERNTEALEHATRIVVLAPALATEKARARELATRWGRLDVYAEALELAAKTEGVGELRIDLWVEAGALHRGTLGNAGAAQALFSRVLDEPTAPSDARLLAAQELSTLLDRDGGSPRLLEVLERRAELEPKQSERQRVLGEAARLAERLGDADRALGLWAQRLERAPDDVEALSARIDLLEGLGRHAVLADDLSRRAPLGDAEQRRADLRRAALVQAERLGDIDRAIAIWSEFEELFGRDAESVDALIELSARAERHDEVVRLLEEAVAAEKDAERRVAQLGQLGDTLRLELERGEDAIAPYARALELSPSAEPPRRGLAELIAVPALAHRASEVLVTALRKEDDARGILSWLETRLGAAPDDASRTAMLLEAGRLYEREGAVAEALRAVSRAFALSLAPAVEAEAERLAALESDFVTLVAAYQKALERAEGERARELHFAQERVWEERLGRPAGAAAAYKEALLLAPRDVAIAAATIRAAMAAHLHADAAWAFVHASQAHGSIPAELVGEFEARAEAVAGWDDALESLGESVARKAELSAELTHDLKRQLALWHRDRRHDADAAEFVLRRAVVDHPRVDTLRMLAELERRAPGRPLVRTLESLADLGDDELGTLHEAAEVALRHVGDQDTSVRLLERVLSVAAASFREAAAANEGAGRIAEWAIENLLTLARASGDAKRVTDLLEQAAELPFSQPERTAFTMRAAEIASGFADDGRAVTLCTRVLAVQPTHEQAITLLASLHEKAGRSRELLELRERELALDRPLERRLYLRLDLARVLGMLDGDDERRIQVLRENLDSVAGHPASLEALDGLLVSLERFEASATLLEGQAREIARAEPVRAARLYERAGRTAEEHLADLGRLQNDFRSAVVLDPSVPVLDRLAELAHDRGDAGAEVGWLVQRLLLTPPAATANPADRRATVVRLASAQVVADERDAARTLLQAELDADPEGNEVRALLCKLCEEAEDYAALAVTLEEGVAYADDDAARVELLRSAARIVHERLSDVARAIPLFDRASQLAPEDRALRLTLAEALRENAEYDRARQLLSDMLEEFGRRRTKERAQVHEQLALIAEAVDELDEALEQAESASKIERMDARILLLVGRLARRKGQLERAEQAYRTLLLIVSRAAERAEGDSQTVGESAILFELYRIAEAEGQDERARELLGSALELATRDPNEALELEAELTRAGKADLLVQALDDRLRSGVEGPEAARILLTQAQILAKNGHDDAAFEARLRAVAQAPDDARLVEGTLKAAEALGRTADAVVELSRLAELPGQRVELSAELWFRLGSLLESGEPLRAAEYFERAQATHFKPRRTFQALDRLLGLLGDPGRSQRALERFVDAPEAEGSPQLLADALYRLGELEWNRQGLASAGAHFVRALEIEAQDARVLTVIGTTLTTGELDPALSRLWVRVARAAGTPDDLLQALSRAAELPDAEPAEVLEAVELARASGDARRPRLLSQAIAAYRAAGDLAPVRELLVERADLGLALGDARLAAELLALAYPLFDGERSLGLELRFAELCHRPLGDSAAAVSAYESLAERWPGERRIWQPLFALYREAGRTDEIEARIVEIEGAVVDPVDLELLRMERVRILLSAGRFEEAETVLSRTLAERPDFAEAAEILLQMLSDQGRHDERRETLEDLLSKARQRGDGEQIARYGLALADLHADDHQEAIDVLTAGLPWTRERREVLVRLLELLGSQPSSDRAEVLENLLSISQGAEAVDRALELAAMQSELGDDYGMGRALEMGFRAAPDDPRVADLYLGYLEREDDRARLAEARLLQAAASKDALEAARLFALAGEAFDRELGDPQRAAEAYEKAFERDPEQVEYLSAAVEQRSSLGEAEQALARVTGAIERSGDGNRAELLQLRARLIAREAPDDVEALERAERDLARALESFVSEDLARDIQGQRADYLLRMAELHATRGDSERERSAVLELGRVQVEVGERRAALETFAAWLRAHEDDGAVAEELTARALEAEDYDTALFASGLAFTSSREGDRRRTALVFADAAERAGQPFAARDALLTVVREAPTDTELRGRLRRIYEAAGAHRELAEMLMVELEGETDNERRYVLLVEAGDLLSLSGDGKAAIELYELARELATEPYGITTKLADGYVEQGDIEAARKVLSSVIDAHGKRRSPELSVLQHALARVARASGDVDGMYGLLEMALMSDRNNVEVAAELAVRAQEDGRWETAIKALQMITLSKANASVGKAEAYYRQAQIAELQHDPKKAALLARRALTTDEGYPEAQKLLDRLGA
ncbi:MAG TPA: tetratricopeptide repeat protein [Polyangiaceae bacterium]|nr:tetratricopeptide repeat protein [Polyangiaceae bacterium]